MMVSEGGSARVMFGGLKRHCLFVFKDESATEATEEKSKIPFELM